MEGAPGLPLFVPERAPERESKAVFVDQVVFEVQAGRGGDGRVSFLREKFRPMGGPDGGDGGDGGSIVLLVSPARMTLRDVGHQRRYKAKDGEIGGRKNMAGRDADDVVIPVPPGTLVYEEESGKLVVDLTTPGERFVLARGGRGGKGNARFATAINQAPRVATRGGLGQGGRYRLELKLIAEVGIVGLPNAGKSTFLGRVTEARPKVAAYPFTTIQPHLGIARLDPGREVILADIPGLIEGASLGKGLGDEFLRHIERTRILLHLVDGTAPDLGGPEPADAWRTIRGELTAYRAADLASKPEVVALNKADALAPEVAAERAEALARAVGGKVHVISGLSGRGTAELLEDLRARIEALGPAPVAPAVGDPGPAGEGGP